MSLKKSRNTKATTPRKRNCFKFLQMKKGKNFNETDRARKVTTDVTFRRNRPSPVMARVSRVFFASGYGYIKGLKLFTVPEITTIAPITINNNKYISFIYFNVTIVTSLLTPLKMRLSGLRYLL